MAPSHSAATEVQRPIGQAMALTLSGQAVLQGRIQPERTPLPSLAGGEDPPVFLDSRRVARTVEETLFATGAAAWLQRLRDEGVIGLRLHRVEQSDDFFSPSVLPPYVGEALVGADAGWWIITHHGARGDAWLSAWRDREALPDPREGRTVRTGPVYQGLIATYRGLRRTPRRGLGRCARVCACYCRTSAGSPSATGWTSLGTSRSGIPSPRIGYGRATSPTARSPLCCRPSLIGRGWQRDRRGLMVAWIPGALRAYPGHPEVQAEGTIGRYYPFTEKFVAAVCVGDCRRSRFATDPIEGLAMHKALLFMSGLFFALSAAAQEQRVFRDWVATCDNTRHCALIGLSLADSEGWAHLRFERSGEPTAWIGTMHLELAEALPRAGEWSLWADENRLFSVGDGELRCGQPYPPDQCYSIEIREDAKKRKVMEMLRRADVLTLVVDEARIVAGVSLDGASAALLWVDDRQGRVGSETALLRSGPKPASAIAPPPPPPRVQVRRDDWRALPQDRVRPVVGEILRNLAPERCDRGDEPDPGKEGADALRSDSAWQDGGGRMLASLYCYAGAYNVMSLWFLRAGDGRWEELGFHRPLRGQEEAKGELVNATFDPASGLIESFDKGRGLGDCGENGVWAWDGARFVLVKLRALSECRGVGSDAWPVLYRAIRE